LIAQEGIFITNPDEGVVMKRDFFIALGLERYRASATSLPAFSAMDDEVFLSSLHILQANWRLVSVVPTRAIVADVAQALFQIIVISLILFVVAILISLTCARLVVKPLRDLSTYSATLSQGNFFGAVPEYSVAEVPSPPSRL
jgi:sensor histidine kinase YesM